MGNERPEANRLMLRHLEAEAAEKRAAQEAREAVTPMVMEWLAAVEEPEEANVSAQHETKYW